MFKSSVIILCAAFFVSNYAESAKRSTFCVTGSILSSFVDGKYDYKETNANGSIYYNEQSNLYLFPAVESEQLKQYLIGPNLTIMHHSPYSFSNIQTLSSYTFIEKDFMSNWQSWIVIDNTLQLVHDTLMRLVNCNPIYYETTLYKWINYSVSIESSIYHNSLNGLYLYRSNIGQQNEKWQIYNGTNFETISHFNITSHIRTNTSVIFNDRINTTTEIANNIIEYQTVTKDGNKNELLTVIATIGGILVMSISIVAIILVIVKKYVFGDNDKIKANKNNKNNNTTQLQTNTKPETNSKLNINDKQKQSKYINELQIRIKKKSLSVYVYDENRNSRNSSINSPHSRSSYADILPPTKPPPLGMRPILTSKQQANRPLPPTPTTETTQSPIGETVQTPTVEIEYYDDDLCLSDLI
eukprot:152242_1